MFCVFGEMIIWCFSYLLLLVYCFILFLVNYVNLVVIMWVCFVIFCVLSVELCGYVLVVLFCFGYVMFIISKVV